MLPTIIFHTLKYIPLLGLQCYVIYNIDQCFLLLLNNRYNSVTHLDQLVLCKKHTQKKKKLKRNIYNSKLKLSDKLLNFRQVIKISFMTIHIYQIVFLVTSSIIQIIDLIVIPTLQNFLSF